MQYLHCVQTGEGPEFAAEVAGDRVPLQRLQYEVPADNKVSALTFVIRSDDGSRWWRDGVLLSHSYTGFDTVMQRSRFSSCPYPAACSCICVLLMLTSKHPGSC